MPDRAAEVELGKETVLALVWGLESGLELERGRLMLASKLLFLEELQGQVQELEQELVQEQALGQGLVQDKVRDKVLGQEPEPPHKRQHLLPQQLHKFYQ